MLQCILAGSPPGGPLALLEGRHYLDQADGGELPASWFGRSRGEGTDS